MDFTTRLNVILEGESQREFSSVQVDLPPELAKKLLAFAANILKDDLVEDGIEDNSHVTVKFGLHTNNPSDIKPLLAGEPPISLKFGKMGIFKANENRNSDVLIINIDSAGLHHLNKKIRDGVECTDTYPEYKPHATIAYLKPGVADDYITDDFEGMSATIDEIVFSGRDRKITKFKLEGD